MLNRSWIVILILMLLAATIFFIALKIKDIQIEGAAVAVKDIPRQIVEKSPAPQISPQLNTNTPSKESPSP